MTHGIMPAVPGQPYVARFGPTRRDLLLVPASALFVGLGVYLAATVEAVPGYLAALGGGAYLALWTVTLVSARRRDRPPSSTSASSAAPGRPHYRGPCVAPSSDG